jgi:2-oxoglutarate dehydrogenase E2 component (dihydrolipoamide succinyltransferase)
MPIELKIPVVGESISEVQISQWLKAEGDSVQKDEPVAVIDSEKTTFDLSAPDNGTLARILHVAGDTVRVGEVIAQFEAGGSKPAEPKTNDAVEGKAGKKSDAKAAPKTRAAAKVEAHAKEDEQQDSRGQSDSKRKSNEPAEGTLPTPEAGHGVTNEENDQGSAGASPSQEPERRSDEERRLAGESEATPAAPATMAPSKPGRSMSGPGSSAREKIVPMTMLRRTIARRLVEAQQTMAMLTTFNEVDMDVVQKLRHQQQQAFQERHGVKLGLMSFFVKAAIDALKQFPQLNASVRDDDIVYWNRFDIGMAIATERGLVVPTMRGADLLGFAEIEKRIATFARQARESTLKPEDLEGGTFTITNGGVFGSLLSTPIINPPQSGILGLHSIEDRPVARDGSVVIRPMMYVALTYDHRIVDGREAVLFLRRIKELIEDPARMLVDA